MSERAVVQVEIRNSLGLHARPAMAFVDMANKFKCAVTVQRPGAEAGSGVDGKSIMQMMMLAATKGTVLEVVAEGEDCEAAIAEIRKLVESGFDEE